MNRVVHSDQVVAIDHAALTGRVVHVDRDTDHAAHSDHAAATDHAALTGRADHVVRIEVAEV